MLIILVNHYKYETFFILLLTFYTNDWFSQGYMNEGVLASRYWNYRYALRGNDIDPSFSIWEPGFVEVGEGQGFSLPMASRLRLMLSNISNSPLGTPINNWEWQVANGIPTNRRGNVIGSRHGALSWGDGPQDLTRYLIVLSTELELLTKEAYKYGKFPNNHYTKVVDINDIINNNINLYNQLLMTYDELDKALAAAERLDWFAETTYGKTQDWDGFFVRDDVPSNFNDDCKFGCAQTLDPNYLNNTTGRYYNGHSFYSSLSNHASAIELGNYSSTDPHHCPMSQDLFDRLLLGLVYTKKFSEFHKDVLGDPKNIYSRAHGYIDRMIWKVFPSYNIKDPNGNSVNPGPSLMWASGPLYSIYQRYGDGDENGPAWFVSNTVGEPMWLAQKVAYTAEWWAGQLAWYGSLLGSPIFLGPYHQHELFGFISVLDDRNPMFLNNSLSFFGTEVAINGGKELDYQINYLMEALRYRLHGGAEYLKLPDYRDFLNRWNFGCEHETRNYKPLIDPGVAFQERNGLDYMIMYNLYKLHLGENDYIDITVNQLSSYIPMYNRVVQGVFPKTIPYNFLNTNMNFWPPVETRGSVNVTYGSQTNPATIKAANFLDLRTATLGPNAHVIFQAPHLEVFPGFSVQLGAVADILPNGRMDCTPYQANNSGSNVIYSKMATVEATPKVEKTISLYPNPTEGDASIRFTNYENSLIHISIYNMVGKKLLDFSKIEILDTEQDYHLALESLTTGVYLVKVQHGESFTTLKLEKN